MLKALVYYDASVNGWEAWYIDKNNQTQSYCREFKSHHTHDFTSSTWRGFLLFYHFLNLPKIL